MINHTRMKYFAGGAFALLAVCAYVSVSVSEAQAFGISQPFGGLVTITASPNVTCEGGAGPVTIMPSGSSAATPYYFPAGTVASGTWVLGNYDSVLDESSCQDDDGPYPVYRVSLFGSSR